MKSKGYFQKEKANAFNFHNVLKVLSAFIRTSFTKMPEEMEIRKWMDNYPPTNMFQLPIYYLPLSISTILLLFSLLYMRSMFVNVISTFVIVFLVILGRAINRTLPPQELQDEPPVNKNLFPYYRNTDEFIELSGTEGKVLIYQIPLLSEGIQFGARMTVIRLEGENCGDSIGEGSLFVHSPIMNDSAKLALKRLNASHKISYMLAPNFLHHFYVKSFQDEFRQCQCYGAPGLQRHRPDLELEIVQQNKRYPWSDEIDHEVIEIFQNDGIWYGEVVLFHKKSKSLILTDLIENYGWQEAPFKMRIITQFVGMYRRATCPTDTKMIMDRKRLKSRFKRILEWDFDKIIISHGRMIESNARSIFKDAFAFILSSD